MQYVNCINNISSFKLNETIKKMKCFNKNNWLENPCLTCGNNYFEKIEIIGNKTYANSYENKEGNYFDDKLSEYKLCYPSCKSCDKGGNKTEHNCIKCKEEYKLEINISEYKNCFIDSINYLESYSIIDT